jgi:hypothetical protein
MLLRSLLPWMRARVDVARGVGEAVEADFVAATRGLRAFGAPLYLGRALLDHAEWLDAHDQMAEAMPVAAEARHLFVGLDAQPWIARAERLAGSSAAPADLAAARQTSS